MNHNRHLNPAEHDISPECEFCDVRMELWDSGENWTCYRCPECGETISNEPFEL